MKNLFENLRIFKRLAMLEAKFFLLYFICKTLFAKMEELEKKIEKPKKKKEKGKKDEKN